MIHKNLIEDIIGKGFASKLDEPVFQVNGSWSISRRKMVDEIGCANFIAAAKLAKVLKKLRVNSPAQLFRLDPVSLARTKGIGESCIFVAMCIIAHAKYDLGKWWNTEKKFQTVKHTIHAAKKHRQEV